jgi:hypothetical protein
MDKPVHDIQWLNRSSLFIKFVSNANPSFPSGVNLKSKRPRVPISVRNSH